MTTHTFLTGDIQVGKSTIIRKLLAHTGLSADGFKTYWETPPDDSRALFLSPFPGGLHNCDRFCIARAAGDGLVRVPDITEIFDSHGTEILQNSGRCEIIIMDELGFLESDAMRFRGTVLSLLDGDVPILGVIKPRRTEFLDAVRNHPKIRIIEVTKANRNGVLSALFECLT